MPPAIELDSIRKDYRGLRPLRIDRLVVAEREAVALGGIDAPASEVLTNLITGAALPDTGSVRVLGEDTSAIADPDTWLASLDRFGILSDRVALVDGFTLRQNIAIALTLDVDPLSEELSGRVASLAAETGLQAEHLDVRTGNAAPAARFRARLARAIAGSPRILLAEHPTASLPRSDVPLVASNFFQLVRGRGLSALITTVDPDFIRGADRHVMLNAASGRITGPGVRAWFSRKRR